MNRKFKILITSFAALCVAAAVITFTKNDLMNLSFAVNNSTWVHYNKALPGSIEGSEYGCREYWVECGGSYQFSKPTSTRIEEGKSYDFGEFETNDPRYIIPIIEKEGEFKSVLRDLSLWKGLSFNEIEEIKTGYDCEYSDLPTVAGESKNVVYYPTSDADCKPYYYVKTNAYTKVFNDWANFRHYFGGTASAGSTIVKYAENVYQDGIFAVSSDFAITQNVQFIDVLYTTEHVDRGFRGTFDGRGHKISESSPSYGGGIFGGVLGGTVKNFTLDTVKLANEDRGALCSQAHNGNFSNITINISSISNTSTNGTGVLAGKWLNGNTFTNVTVNAPGLTLPNVFGGYFGNNIFSNVRINADAVTSWCGNNYSGSNLEKPEGVIFNGESKEIIVEGDPQDVLVNSSDTQSLYLGSEYSSINEVTSISLIINEHTYSLGTHVKNIVVPQELKNTPTDSGACVIKVDDGNGNKFIIDAFAITKVINNTQDFTSLAGYSTNESAVKGYYVVKEDLNLGSYSKTTLNSWDSPLGFEGTLDGRNHTVTLDIASAKNGIFGVIKNATIKNINIVSSTYTGQETLLAYYMSGCTIINVNLSIDSSIKEVSGPGQYVLSNGGHLGNSYSNFTFTSSVGVDSLYHHYYKNDTFINCTATLPSLRLFADGTNIVSEPPSGFTIIRTYTEYDRLTLDRSNATNVLPVSIPGTVNDVYWNDTKISTSLTINSSVFGKTFGDAGNLYIHYTSNSQPMTAAIPLTIASKVIKTVSDVKNFLTIADSENDVTGDGIYTGYFAVANDITWDGSQYSKAMPEIPFNVKGDRQIGKGFVGTFDGKGHSISGLDIRVDTSSGHEMSAFITRLGEGGIIKNLGFTNFSLSNSAVVAAWGEGICENIYVSLKNNFVRYGTFAITNTYSYLHNSVLLKDSIIDIRNETSERTNVLGQCSNENTLLYNNVLVLRANENKKVINYNGDSESGVSGSYAHDYSLSYNTYSLYENYADLLRDNGDEINNWEAFSYKDNVLKFGEQTIANQAPSTISTHRFMDDYVIVYDKDNIESIRGAFLIEKELYKASGNITYSEAGNRTNVFVENGKNINKVAYTKYSSSKNLIVVGNDEVAKEAGITTTSNRIAKIGNSIIITSANKNDYLACAYEFLIKVIGYKALGQDYIRYNNIPTTLPQIDEEFNVATELRLTTNGLTSYFLDKMAINIGHSGSLFPSGPVDNPSESVHNALDWLPYATYGTSHPNWYRSTSGSEKLDICFTAHGNNSEYTAMVSTLADRMYETLSANPTLDKLCFGMEDIQYNRCSCSACNSAESQYGSYSGQGIKLLNDVTTELDKKPDMANRDYIIYLLAYYFTTKAPTGISLKDKVGVMVAPLRYDSGTSTSNPSVPKQAKSIYDSSNDFSRTQIANWNSLVKNKSKNKDSIGFWFYNSMFKNYFGFMDTFETMLTWIEYAAHVTNGDFSFMFIQGQSSQYPNSAFETFKQYINSKALIEIMDKVNPYDSYSSDSAYMNDIGKYLHELEDDFFSITSRSSDERFIPTSDISYSHISNYGSTLTFSDGGYYGSASTNYSMYRMYLCMRDEYCYLTTAASTKLAAEVGAEYVLQTSNSATFNYSVISTSLFSVVNNGSVSLKTYYRFSQYRYDRINSLVAHYGEAIANIENYSGSDKLIAKRHIEVEGLAALFLVCMSNSTTSGYGFGGGITINSKTYTLAEVRTLFKNKCTDYGITKVNEGGLLSKIYSIWGI